MSKHQKLPNDLQEEIIAFLKSLPTISDKNCRQALLAQACLEPEIEAQISIETPPASFVPLLVSTLVRYGTLEDDRHALIAVLEAAKSFVGQEGQAECDQLISRIQKLAEKATQQINEPSQQETPPPMNTKKTILILSANPKDTARLRLDEEIRGIKEGLRRSNHREDFTIQQREALKLPDLRRALLDENPQLVHFCGHANVEGLMLEDETGKAVLASPQALAGLFKQFPGIECVLLNACYSEPQAQAICQHIPYVIGMSSAIHDKAALEFAIGFYDAIGAGRTIEDAFEFGCNAIELYKLPDTAVPILNGRKDKSSTQHMFNDPNTGKNYVPQEEREPPTDSLQMNIPGSFDEMRLVEALLSCPTIKNRNRRNTVINRLPHEISNNITRDEADKFDVMNTVEACMNYSEGIKKLLETVSFFEGNSIPMRNVYNVLNGTNR